MAFDVFLTYAPEDMDMASLVARRLRALKFKVRFNKKGEQATFDEKDTRDVMKSRTMLVIWSEHALTSDWVRAAVSIGHSRENMLVQTVTDETIPYEPFRRDKRFELAGFTSRTTVEGWYETVEALGVLTERADLKTWMDIPSKDEAAKAEWLQAHPGDPLAVHASALREKQLGKSMPTPTADKAARVASASAIGNPKQSAPVTLKSAQATGTLQHGPDNKSAVFMVPAVFTGILALFVTSWFLRSAPAPSALQSADIVCPKGEVLVCVAPSRMLEPGPIVNDTEE